MKARIIKIGNSKGVRIPKLLIEETGLGEEVEIQVEDNRIIIAPAPRRPRSGWASTFQKMAQAGDDALLDGNTQPPTQWEKKEWEWQ